MITDYKLLTIDQIHSIYVLIEDKETAGYQLGQIIGCKTRTAREKMSGIRNKQFAFLELEKAQEFIFNKYPTETQKVLSEMSVNEPVLE